MELLTFLVVDLLPTGKVGEHLPVEGGRRTFRISSNDDSFGGKAKGDKGNGRSCGASARTDWWHDAMANVNRVGWELRCVHCVVDGGGSGGGILTHMSMV
jgi:hypothetical protein